MLIENFRSPAIMERLGLGYRVMAALNPRIIYVQASAFGREGPWVGMFSHEWVAQTVSGFVSVTGNDKGVPEWSRATANQDWNGAMMNLAVVLAGLLRREQSGRGMMIETAQLGSSIFAGITRFAEVLAGQASAPAIDVRASSSAPPNGWTCASADGLGAAQPGPGPELPHGGRLHQSMRTEQQVLAKAV